MAVGYDAVESTALSRRKVTMMTAGTANSPSVAEQALFMMLTLGQACVREIARHRQGRHLGYRSARFPKTSTARKG